MSEQLEKIAASNEESIEVESGDKKIKLRGSDLLTSIIGMIMCASVVYLYTEIAAHAKDADKGSAQLAEVLKEIAKNQKAQVQATRVTNCMLSIEQRDRQRQLETCERLAR